MYKRDTKPETFVFVFDLIPATKFAIRKSFFKEILR